MLRITTILLLLCTSWSYSQIEDSILLQYEYEYFHATTDDARNNTLVEKLNYHLNQPTISEQAFFDLKRINPNLLESDQKQVFFWNASLMYYITNNHYQAVHYIEECKEVIANPQEDTSFLLLQYFIYAEYDTSISNVLFSQLLKADTSFQCLTCVSEVSNFELKHKKMRILASYFIPGIGTMSAGKPVKGILSLSLNVLSAFAMVYTIQNQLWINTFGWGTNLIGKFYTGNIRLATKVIDQKEQDKKKELAHACELQLRTVFQHYPLNFKLRVIR